MSPTGSADAITVTKLARIIWRQRLLCSAVALVILLVGGSVVLTRPKVYEATSSVALLPVSSNPAILPNYPNLITSLIPTYLQLVSSPVLLNKVAATLPFSETEAQLASAVHAQSLSNAAVINIVADSTTPARAQAIASRATAVFLAQLRGNGVVIPRIYGAPTASGSPVAPKTSLLLAIVVVLAVVLGLSSGLAWDRIFGTALSPGDLLRLVRGAIRGLSPPRVAPDPPDGQQASARAAHPPGEDVGTVRLLGHTAESADRHDGIGAPRTEISAARRGADGQPKPGGAAGRTRADAGGQNG